MVSIGGEPRLFTQGKSTGEFALLYDYFWGVGLKTPWSVVSYVCNGLETAETNGCFAANAPPAHFKRPAKSTTAAGRFIFSRNPIEQGRLRLFFFQSLSKERDGVWEQERRRKTCFLSVCLLYRGHKSTAFRVCYGWGFQTAANPSLFAVFGLPKVRFLSPKRRFEQNAVVGSTLISLPFFARPPDHGIVSFWAKKRRQAFPPDDYGIISTPQGTPEVVLSRGTGRSSSPDGLRQGVDVPDASLVHKPLPGVPPCHGQKEDLASSREAKLHSQRASPPVSSLASWPMAYSGISMSSYWAGEFSFWLS